MYFTAVDFLHPISTIVPLQLYHLFPIPENISSDIFSLSSTSNCINQLIQSNIPMYTCTSTMARPITSLHFRLTRVPRSSPTFTFPPLRLLHKFSLLSTPPEILQPHSRQESKMSFSNLVSDLAFRDSNADERGSQISHARSHAGRSYTTSTTATSVSISGDISSQLHAGYSHPLSRSWQAERQLTKVTSYRLPAPLPPR